MRIVNAGSFFGAVSDGFVTPLGTDVMEFYADRARFDPAGAGPRSDPRQPMPLGDLVLRSPVPRPAKVIGVGPNYSDHASEAVVKVPASISDLGWFGAFASSVIGPGEPIRIPRGVVEVDWEAELGVVIGRRASRVSLDAAGGYIAGYVCVNDVSARKLQRGNTLKGKAIDTFLPMGPWVATRDEFPDWRGRAIRSYLNGQLYQDGTTDDMVYGVEQLISSISELITLEPGDVITTGTPSGTGGYCSPPRYLRDGDVVAVEVEGLGRLENPVEEL